jgi:threonine dehydrogenase-like Zn-dependent dehydrogenase
MTAAVMYAPGDIRVEEVNVASPGPAEVLLKVAACGVCGSDIPRMLRNGGYVMPIICGHEFSGYVEQLGEGVTGFELGDHWLSLLPGAKGEICDYAPRRLRVPSICRTQVHREDVRVGGDGGFPCSLPHHAATKITAIVASAAAKTCANQGAATVILKIRDPRCPEHLHQGFCLTQTRLMRTPRCNSPASSQRCGGTRPLR